MTPTAPVALAAGAWLIRRRSRNPAPPWRYEPCRRHTTRCGRDAAPHGARPAVSSG
ncbi:MAG: hypothetical protein JJU25_05820 [Halomonas sp.]|nr:hypothetical protein [Halomonas sp.]